MSGDSEPFEFEGVAIGAGTVRSVDVPIARLPAGTWLSMPVTVVNGRKPGPAMWICGAVHGDELNGLAIVRGVLGGLDAGEMSGTLLAVPIVNVFGVTMGSRYLPDRRDLNRSFPGSSKGSLASRLAHLFVQKVVSRCEVGLDFHAGANGRSNLPQIRCDLDDPVARRCATAFGPPMILHASIRDGSLRAAARALGIHVLVYEAGETLRFDPQAVEIGVRGTLGVMGALRMLRGPTRGGRGPTRVRRGSRWIRARRSGFCLMETELGDSVRKGQRVARITEGTSQSEVDVRSPMDGVVIGLLRTALVHRGDAIVNLAEEPA